MASEIKVDTIVNAGGDNDSGIDLATNDAVKIKIANAVKAEVDSSGHVKLDTVKGYTSAASISVVGEGGSNTTNLQQGLAKAFVNHDASASVDDSFNTSSVTDSGTGHYGLNFTNAMANAHYIGSGSNLGSTSEFASVITSDGASPTASRMDYQVRNLETVNPTDQSFNRAMTHGDLA